MNALFDAIRAKFVADGKYGLAELHNTEAVFSETNPLVYPYGVFSLISAASELADFTTDWENCLIQFNLFDDDPSSSDINAAYKALKTAFHKFDLDIDGCETISLVKEVANLIRVEDRWQYNVSFRIIVQ